MSNSEILSKRLYIGGLSENVSESELLERFSRFGKVSNVSLKTRVDDNGEPLKSFAHLNLQGDEASIKKCFNTYQNSKWKGSVMKLQYAKESVLERLQKEREEETSANVKVPKPESEKSSSAEILITAKGVPGTPVPGKKDWVVGKYGRAVPVMKLKKSYKIPMVKHDPSKYCHTAKVFKDEEQDSAPENSCNKLTWEINKPDSEITKKRKGEYPEISKPLKKKIAVGSLNRSEPSEESSLLTFSDNLYNKRKAFLSLQGDQDDLEVVKIGTVPKRPGISSLADTSNKFDSDIESEPESVHPSVLRQQNSVTGSSGTFKAFKRPSENGLKPSPQNHTRGMEPENSSKEVSKPLSNTQSERNQSFSYNSAGIPEFKGLSMLAGLAQPFTSSAISGNKGVDKFSSTKQAQMPISEATNSKISKAVLSNDHRVMKNIGHSNSSLTPSVRENAEPHTVSFAESSIIANPVQDVTIATPAPFSTSREDNSFKTSTPNASTEIVNQGTAHMADESKSFRLVPEFKGLGMISDYNVDNEKDSVLKSPRKLEPDTAIKETSLLNKSSPSFHAKLNLHQEDSHTLSDTRLNLKLRESSKKRKRGHDSSSDSDSSAGTAEIVVRYKEEKLSGTAQLSKPEYLVKQSKITSIPSAGDVSVDSNLMSEFVSGFDEFGQCPIVAPANKVSEDDSYDSDLDSNDFALVAKKLRQKAMRSEQGGSEKLNSRDKKRKDSLTPKETLSLTRDTKGLDKQGMSDLQSKLVKIAGTERESEGGSGHMKQEKGGNLSDKEKHRAANEKRLEAVKQQAKQRRQQQQLMQQALRNVDSVESNKKRIVFDSSDDDSGTEDQNVKHNSKDTMHLIAEKKAHKQENTGPALFDSSDDESDEDDYDEMFKSKPQFEGKRGEKLLKLENRIGDKRFKLDAKFADTDSEEEEDDDKDEEAAKLEDASRNAMDIDSDLSSKLKEEKNSNLKVLEDVVGKSTLDRFSEKLSRNTKKIIDMNSVRFDPTKVSVSSTKLTDSKKRETAIDPKTGSKQQLREASDSTNLKKEKKARKKEFAKVDDVAKPSKVNSDEDANNDQAESKDHSTKKKGKESLSKKDEPDSKSKTNVELSSSLLDMFKAKAEHKGDKDATFSFSQQFGEADSDEDDVNENEEGSGNRLFKCEKDKTVIGRTEPKSDSEEDDTGEKKRNEASKIMEEERAAVVTTEVMSSSESDLSSDEGEEDMNISKKSISSSTDKAKSRIDDDLQDAGRVDIRFTKEQWLEQWDALRQNIIKIYKKKHKDALKKKRIHGETKRKKEFLKNSRKSSKKQCGAFKKR
ncbi:hypothetical protein RRG08_003834 [Elysia crispata]|uniref:RRM domain-containing protein n=1 Tax=Elysia crispata TaxID=231223 RepID=A0AAE0ZDX6_9GAST|nr:hypothetical protein RRG08_003834 [Elysia crispata]